MEESSIIQSVHSDSQRSSKRVPDKIFDKRDSAYHVDGDCPLQVLSKIERNIAELGINHVPVNWLFDDAVNHLSEWEDRMEKLRKKHETREMFLCVKKWLSSNWMNEKSERNANQNLVNENHFLNIASLKTRIVCKTKATDSSLYISKIDSEKVSLLLSKAVKIMLSTLVTEAKKHHQTRWNRYFRIAELQKFSNHQLIDMNDMLTQCSNQRTPGQQAVGKDYGEKTPRMDNVEIKKWNKKKKPSQGQIEKVVRIQKGKVLSCIVNEHRRRRKSMPKEDSINQLVDLETCLLYTSPSPRDQRGSRMPSSA